MAPQGDPSTTDQEAVVRRMDYERILRQSRGAFDDGDTREGLRLLEVAAILERGPGVADSAPDGGEGDGSAVRGARRPHLWRTGAGRRRIASPGSRRVDRAGPRPTS